MSEQELIAHFENGQVSADSFHHADHVKLAFAYLRVYPPLQALERFAAALREFAKVNGKENRYHETITWAYLLMIRERMARAGEPQDWQGFAEANADLLSWSDCILKHYYSDATLKSDLARSVFVFPDKPARTSL